MSSQLRYPKDAIYESYSDYCSFKFKKYRPPFSGQGGGNRSDVSYYNQEQSELEDDGDLEQIFLYIPEDIQVKYGSSWGDKSFTNVQKDLLNIAGGGTNLNFGDTATAAVNAIRGASGRLPSLIAQGIANGMNNLPGKIAGNTELNDVLAGTQGVVMNPNVELMFNGFALRQFSLQFKFRPQNAEEARVIKRLVDTFKIASLPRYGGDPKLDASALGQFFTTTTPDQSDAEGGGNANYITVPNLVEVEFKKGSKAHPYLPRYKACVISSVDYVLTPDGQYSTYTDGAPVASQLTLGFQESKLVYGSEITLGKLGTESDPEATY